MSLKPNKYQQSTKLITSSMKWLLAVIIIGLLLMVVYFQLSTLKSGIGVLADMSLSWIPILIGLFLISVFFAGVTYQMLALKKLDFGKTLVVELAAAGMNRLLPAGVGNIGVHSLYLAKFKHNVAQIAAVMTVNGLIGLTGHFIILILALVMLPFEMSFDLKHLVLIKIIIAVLAVASYLLLRLNIRVRRWFERFWRDFKKSLVFYRKLPNRPVKALASSMMMTLFNLTIFVVATKAVGLEIDPRALFVVYTGGVLAGSMTPTPGGLGGFEAGLAAGLVTIGVDPAQAIAAALVFRLTTYWLPLLVGPLMFLFVRFRKWV